MKDAESAAADPCVAAQKHATAFWRKTDPVMAALSEATPLGPTDFGRANGFVALLDAIISQQISLAAARSIFARVEEAAGELTPENILALGPGLRECGLSKAKVNYCLDLAEYVAEGRLDFTKLGTLSDEEALTNLVAVKGIGPWSAKMFLMFHFNRMDIVAPEDLGLRQAFAEIYGGTERDAWKRMPVQAKLWSPYNTVAARVLWKHRAGED